jgi:hypothetical protein
VNDTLRSPDSSPAGTYDAGVLSRRSEGGVARFQKLVRYALAAYAS